jgi:hypothetical protein
MHAAFQWLLGLPLGAVVVTVAGLLFMVSRGPIPGACAALVAVCVLGLWIVRLRRDGYYRPMAAAILTGAGVGVVVVGLVIGSINWG